MLGFGALGRWVLGQGEPYATGANALSNDNRGATKLYAEVTCVAEVGGPGFLGFGVANAALSLSTRAGATGDAVGYYTDGKILCAGTVVATSTAWSVGDVVAIAVDVVAATVAFRNVTDAGAWSTPISIASLGAGPLSLVVSTAYVGDAIAANFDADFVGAPPAGHTRWDGTPLGNLAALVATEAGDVFDASGDVAFAEERTGSLLVADPGDVGAFTGTATGVAGTFLVVEARDAAGTAGSVAWTGVLAIPEVTDVAAIAGLVGRIGSFAAADPVDTFAAVGTVRWQAALALIEAGDATVLTGLVGRSGSFAAADPVDAFAATGNVAFAEDRVGTIVATEVRDAAALAGTIAGVPGALAAIEPTDVASTAGLVRWQAALVAADPVDVVVVTGAARWLAVLAAVEPVDVAAVVGTARTSGTFAAADPVDIFAGSGNAAFAEDRTGSLLVAEARDASVVAGAVTGVAGAFLAPEATDAAAAVGSAAWAAILAAADAGDAAALAGGIASVGIVAATESVDAASATGTVRWQATLAATDARDIAASAGAVTWTTIFAATDARDTAALSVTAALDAVGSLAAAETRDAGAVVGQITGVAGTLVATEASSVGAFVGATGWSGTLAVAETADAAIFAGLVGRIGSLATTEVRDGAALAGFAGFDAYGTIAALEAWDRGNLVGGLIGAGFLLGNLTAIEAADRFPDNQRRNPDSFPHRQACVGDGQCPPIQYDDQRRAGSAWHYCR